MSVSAARDRLLVLRFLRCTLYKHCWEILEVLIGRNESIGWNIAMEYLLFESQDICCLTFI